MITCLDIHTHHPSPDAIRSCFLSDASEDVPFGFRSVGIHPWHLTESNAEAHLRWLEEAARREGVVAIGECGLDKLRGAPMEIQQDVFRKCADVAERTSLPLIIHAVKSSGELIRLKKELRPRMTWIIHGFRGKKAVAEEYLKHGFHLSFGEKYREEALRCVPTERLFIETDESTSDIGDICRKIAASRGMSAEELAERVGNNVKNIFFKP